MDIQLIIVIIIGILVGIILARAFYRFFFIKRDQPRCGGCTSCNLPKEEVNHPN